MNSKAECTECGSYSTERVHTEWYSDMIEEVRICHDCPAQYTNKYSLFEKATDEI